MPSGIYPLEKRKGLFQKGMKRSLKSRLEQGETTKGRKASEETKNKMRKPKSEKHKENIRQSKKGNTNGFKKGYTPWNVGKPAWNRGIKSSDRTREKLREWHINNPNRKFSNTSIEQKVAKELEKRGVYFQQNIGLCKIANVDFYLPEYRIVIQCDGDYWHNLLKVKERDAQQDRVLTFNGFNVYRFWEHEINKSVENCINKIKI